jgi:hypothetical protein
MSGLTLYEISDQLIALVDSLAMCETDEQRVECQAEIERYVDAQIHKVDSFCRFLSHLDSQVDLAEKEIKRLKLREMAFTNLQERLEKYAIFVLQRNNLKKLEGDTATLTLRTNTPAVEVDDLSAVPPEFKTIKQEVVPDKRAIKAAIKSGESVPGAHLAEPSVSLIRS